MMLERVLYDILAAGREELNENPEFFDRLFGPEHGAGMAQAEIDQIRTFWQGIRTIDPDGTEQTGVSIVHQFPRDTTKFPCWSIVLLGEQESTQFLGDEAGYLGDEGEDVLTSIWDKTYAIFTYATSPLVALYYYELSRFFITKGRPYLKSEEGGYVLSSKFSGGDMAPNDQYLPANLFVRRFQVELSREERVLGEPQLRGKTVRGIFRAEDSVDVVANVSVGDE